MQEELDIESLSKIKSKGRWVRDENGGLSAVFRTGFFSNLVIPEQQLKSLYTQAFNACSDVIGKLQEADSERLKSVFGKRKTIDWFGYETNTGNIDLQRQYEMLERVRDILDKTIKNKDTALKAQNMTLEC